MHGGGLELALVFLLAAVIAVPVFRRFGLGAVLGYLVAGVVLGPYGVRVIRDVGPVLAASEIGVVMLLFVIGLELSPARLQVMRKPVFGAGGLQMGVCGVVLALPGAWCATSTSAAAIVVGLGLAFSSTAVGLQLLAERKALTPAHGRLAFAILLFQDLMAIPLLAAIPLLGGAKASEGLSWTAIAKAFGAIAGVMSAGACCCGICSAIVARTNMPEVFTASALLVVLGIGVDHAAGGADDGPGRVPRRRAARRFGIPPRTRSADRPVRRPAARPVLHRDRHDRSTCRRVLDDPFFVARRRRAADDGEVRDALRRSGAGRADCRSREALLLGGVLALGGEFAFVVFGDAFSAGLIDRTLRAHLVAIVGVSMALTPPLYIGLSRWLVDAGRPKRSGARSTRSQDEAPEVLIAGLRPLRPGRRAPARGAAHPVHRDRAQPGAGRVHAPLRQQDLLRRSGEPRVAALGGRGAACGCSSSRSTTSKPTCARCA